MHHSPPSSSSSSPYHDTLLHHQLSSNPSMPTLSFDHHISPPAAFSEGSSLFTSPPPSYYSPSYFQRSSSFLSLQKQVLEYNNQTEFLEFQPISMRRVFSTGDIQPLSESCTQEGAEASVGRVGRYNPEERKERIERYRGKRNLRNFHKKITYVCRKTLADSRPRVRGRFAPNGEVEAEAGEGNGYNNFQTSGGEFYPWRQAPVTMTEDDDEDLYGYDNELWTSYFDVCSIDNLIS